MMISEEMQRDMRDMSADDLYELGRAIADLADGRMDDFRKFMLGVQHELERSGGVAFLKVIEIPARGRE